MDKKFKQQLILVAFGVVLFAALDHLNYVADFFSLCVSMLAPVLAGLLMAFVLSVPTQGIAKRLGRCFPKAKASRIDLVSMVLALLAVTAALALVCVMAVPQLVSSVMSVVELVKEQWPAWAAALQSYGVDTSEFTELTNQLAGLDWKSALEKVMSGAGVVIGSVVSFAGTTVSRVANAAIALVIMFYVLLGRRELGGQVRRVLYAYCKKSTADYICHIARAAHDTYAKFLSGQCVEVVILGLLIFISFSIFRLPYAALVAVLTAVLAFIPYIGAFTSCAVGVLLTLLAEPEKALLCLIVYQAAQFVENQFIYPHVVGGSVGLSPFWTLLAVLLGGQLFGVIGIIFFIPFMALIAQLLNERTEKRLAANNAQNDGEKSPPNQ